jgi:hypothetical protein
MNDSQRLVRIETLLRGISSKGDDHEIRIRRLEKVLYIGIGVAAAGGSAIGSYIGQLGGIN